MTAPASSAAPGADEGLASARGIVLRQLRAARRRLIAQRLVHAGAWAAVVALAGWCVLLAFSGRPASGQGVGVAAGLLGVIVAAAIGGAVGAPNLQQTAGLLDRRADTRDRFQTALDFTARPAPTAWETLALAECARFARDFPVARWTPVRFPRAGRWLVVPLAGLALWSWGVFGLRRATPPTALDAAVEQRAATLGRLADDLRRAASPDAARLAAAMEKSAQRLRSGAHADAERGKAALGEVSSLEAMVEALRAAREQPVSPAELAALAAALAAQDSTREAAAALRAGQLGSAAAQLEKLLQTLAQRGDSAGVLRQLARSLQEQTAKLTDAEKNELARQMQAAAQGAQNGQPGLSQQALQRLAALLRQAGRNGTGGSSGAPGGDSSQPMTEQELQSLLNALADLKNGLRPGEENRPGQPGGGKPGDALARAESFAGQTDPTKGGLAAGGPGHERDAGHNNLLLAPTPPPAVKAQGPATRFTGTPGEGESLQQFLEAASDGSRATRAYRDNYDRLVPAAQNAVEQENIPLGARVFVRKYFENIRPKE